MPKKYNIPVKLTPPRFEPVGKFSTIEFREECAGSCKECVKKKCVYGIFKDNYIHVSSMEEPEYLYVCKSCFRCVQECTKGIFSRVINPEYRTLGDHYWTGDIISRTWYQAHTGKIPVSGAGYRGPFTGSGFDSMWTDMSEIVRPTRDGIHGREYVNTGLEMSRKVTRLKFDENSELVSECPPIMEVQVPILFARPSFGDIDANFLTAAAKAAFELDTMMFISAEEYSEAFKPYARALVPGLTKQNYKVHQGLIEASRMVELAYEPGIEEEIPQLRALKPGLTVAVGIPLSPESADVAVNMARADVDALHFYADNYGNEADNDNPRFLKDLIREIHLKLVDNQIRDKINMVFSGGIAMAEHMAKAIICGADAIAMDTSLLIACECRACRRCQKGLSCPVNLREIDLEWGSQRIINLVGAWRNQLIEVMGAMGIREVRRLRGEVGRSMWFEDLERENFGPIFGDRKVSGMG
jgi:ferredoxin